MKTRTPEVRTIGGFEVSTTRLPPTRALRLAPKVMKIFLPALRLQGMSLMTDGADLVARLGELLATLDDSTLELLYSELLSETSIVMPDEHDRMVSVELSSAQMIDIAFGGLDNGLTLLVQVMIFAGEVNFKRSFFDLAASMGLKRKTTAKTEPQPE